MYLELKPHVNATETMFLNNKLRSTKSCYEGFTNDGHSQLLAHD